MLEFPKVIALMQKIHHSKSTLPSDSDIHQSCEMMLSLMLLDLMRIPPAIPGQSIESEGAVWEWVNSDCAAEVVSAGLLEDFHAALCRIFSPRSLPS